MGEENKEEEKKEEAKKEKREEEKKEEEKKEEETPEIVLKVDMHCEACARKVARALKGFEGVDDITADSKASKVVVKGKTADPIKVCERLQKKSGRKVELISPLPKPPPPDADDQEKKEQQKVEKKEEPPATITVVLNVRMHCEACAQGLRKRIRKIQGVECVETNLASGQVIVKGVVDPVKLVNDVNKKTRKQASIVKDEEKKQEEKKEGEKKDGGEEGEEAKVDEEKKQEEKKEGEKKDGGEEAKVDEEKNNQQLDFNINRSEYWATKNYSEFAYAPQIFSDENPNACFVM